MDPVRHGHPLARNGAYAFVEVYNDGTVIPVHPDGDPVT